MPLRIVISGCSGGGKSSLIAGLAEKGYRTVPEPGRAIVRQQAAIGGRALPWLDEPAFMAASIALSFAGYDTAASETGPVFFDRCFHDNMAHFQRLGLPVPAEMQARANVSPFYPIVFFVPPWPEIFANDDERRQGFDEAVAEYDLLTCHYRTAGYRIVVLPKISIEGRITHVLASLPL